MPEEIKTAPPQINKRLIDVSAVAPEIFIITTKEILALVGKSEMGEVPLIMGHSEETKRPFGTIYVIPQAKKRVAFPLLWDTEPRKFLYPQLFQSLSGPEWASSFTSEADKNGTMHLDSSKYLSESGSEIADLPDLIDAYIKERLPETGTLLLYRNLFSTLDRVHTITLSGKSSNDEEVTKFVRELYGAYPSSVAPGVMMTKATEGVPEGYGVPEIRTASAAAWRYVSAPSAKEAKKKTRFYTSYALAKSHSQDKSDPIFRFKVEDSEPDWKTVKEVHSEVEDSVTMKAASADQGWLSEMVGHEANKLQGNLRTALTKGSQKVIF